MNEIRRYRVTFRCEPTMRFTLPGERKMRYGPLQSPYSLASFVVPAYSAPDARFQAELELSHILDGDLYYKGVERIEPEPAEPDPNFPRPKGGI